MKYTKPPLSIEKQVELLLSRGMVGDKALMMQRLSAISYYRLSGYWFPFRQPDDSFRPGTEFDLIWEHYVFDRKLRVLLMDAVERIEVGVRTLLSYHHAHEHGPFGYVVDPASLPKLGPNERRDLLSRIDEEVGRSRKERFIKHFFEKYGDEHRSAPIWMATEVLSFGTVLRLWQACTNKVKNKIAAPFEVSDEVLRTWLWSLNEVRNVCAHHGRLWNRDLGNKPMIPREKHRPEWHKPVAIDNRRVFVVLTLCAHSLARLSPGSTWAHRLRLLLSEHPRVPVRSMGFPVDWLESPIWKGAAS